MTRAGLDGIRKRPPGGAARSAGRAAWGIVLIGVISWVGGVPSLRAAPAGADEPAGSETRTGTWLASMTILPEPLAPVEAMTAGPAAIAVAPGTPIVSVRIVRHDVFDLDDPATTAAPYRWVNALHAMTRESFIRSLLVFEVGDVVDPLRLAESELILRGTGFLNPVTITAHPAPGGAEIVVETRDQWTIDVDARYDVSGGSQRTGGSISDDNVLGTGKGVFFAMESDAERSSTMFGYKDRAILGSRWQADLKYTTSSDGSESFVRAQYPFFSLATPFAGGLEWLQNDSEEHLWSESEQVVTGAVDSREVETWFGFRLPGGELRTDRLIVGAFAERARYGEWRRDDGSLYARPEDRDLIGPEVGWQHQTFNWKVAQGFRSWQRQEDLALGPNWTVTTGVSSPAFGGDRTRVPYHAAFDVGRWRERTYMWALADLTGRVEDGSVANGISHLELGGAMTGKAGFRLRAVADLGQDLDLDRQLTLGADTGLRGYDPDTFDGTSRVVTNVEWRRQLTGEFLHLAVLGMTAFADAGKTWGARVGPSTEGWRSDIGAGLLLEITRASSVRIIRLEVAFPDRGGSPVYQITSQSLF